MFTVYCDRIGKDPEKYTAAEKFISGRIRSSYELAAPYQVNFCWKCFGEHMGSGHWQPDSFGKRVSYSVNRCQKCFLGVVALETTS